MLLSDYLSFLLLQFNASCPLMVLFAFIVEFIVEFSVVVT
jgi:hypothetical protein